MKNSADRLLRVTASVSLLSAGALSASPYSEAVLADAPVLYYRFDESAGPAIADASGGGNDGAAGGPFVYGAESFHPNLGTALEFDGARSKIDVPALGETVIIEFRFDADEFISLAGWYLDDVQVTVP